MTTEDDFQRALDANPDDHHTRLVFADWLQERDDPRAEGYCALGLTPSAAHHYGTGEWGFDRDGQFPPDGDEIPSDWFDLMARPSNSPHWSEHIHTARTRHEIEDVPRSPNCPRGAARNCSRRNPRRARRNEGGRRAGTFELHSAALDSV